MNTPPTKPLLLSLEPDDARMVSAAIAFATELIQSPMAFALVARSSRGLGITSGALVGLLAETLDQEEIDALTEEEFHKRLYRNTERLGRLCKHILERTNPAEANEVRSEMGLPPFEEER